MYLYGKRPVAYRPYRHHRIDTPSPPGIRRRPFGKLSRSHFPSLFLVWQTFYIDEIKAKKRNKNTILELVGVPVPEPVYREQNYTEYDIKNILYCPFVAH